MNRRTNITVSKVTQSFLISSYHRLDLRQKLTRIMNPQMTVTYQGQLRNHATHLKSGNIVITDAPIDNQGKGEAFSPTDLLCTSLATCMLTLMGITSQSKGIQLGEVHAEIEKVMASNPRRVSEIRIRFTFESNRYTVREKTILENAAKACPVAQSVHPNIAQVIEFVYCE